MRYTALRLGMLALTVLLAGACAHGGDVEWTDQRPVEEGMVQVVNHNWSDMTIYVVQDNGSRQRLGTVTSMTQRLFRLPRHLSAAVGYRLLADPIGSTRTHVSAQLMPADGVVVWTLESTPALSNTTVRSR